MTETLRPRDEADLAELIATHAGPLEVVGAGSKRAIGRPMEAALLDLGALRGVIAYEPDELVFTAHAATPLADIEPLLQAERQRLAFEPPDPRPLLASTAPPTIGGVLAANASGSRRLTAGAARDHFLGFRAVNGRGERFKAGGRVVKNVTGYDLPKLLAGSWGTLAVLTEVTVRVVPAPEADCTLVLEPCTPAHAVQLFKRALDSTCEVTAAALVPHRGLALRLEGFERSVQSRCARLIGTLGAGDHVRLEGDESRRWWHEVAAARALAEQPVVWRVSLPPSEAARVIEALAPTQYLLDWAGGLLWLGVAHADPARVRGALRGGYATLIKAPEAVRASVSVFQPPTGALATLAARLKVAFDPHARLNPGRMS
jgi:glycolate oxidase FAD binding subunit